MILNNYQLFTQPMLRRCIHDNIPGSFKITLIPSNRVFINQTEFYQIPNINPNPYFI